MLPFLSSKAGRGAAIVTAILGQMLLLAAKTLEETLNENKQGDCGGQGGTPGLHLIHQGSCPMQGEALLAALAVTPPCPGILFCTVFQGMCVARNCRGSQGSPALHPTALMLHLGVPRSHCLLCLCTGACSRHLQRSLQAQPCAAELPACRPGAAQEPAPILTSPKVHRVASPPNRFAQGRLCWGCWGGGYTRAT